MTFALPEGSGVLPDSWLQKAVDAGVIRAEAGIEEACFQPASLDLRLGDVAHRLRCSFLPDDRKVEEKLRDFEMEALSLTDGAILERNRPYLIPLLEQVRLPKRLRARANPKSSTGRLDIFTRVISDCSYRFDEIPPGYEGPLYLEVVSRSFTVKVRRGLSLNQLRLITADTHRIPDGDLRDLHDGSPLLFFKNRPLGKQQLAVSNGLFMSLDLTGDAQGVVGYRARRNSRLVDLGQVNHYDPIEFWDPVIREAGDRVVLEPEEFYLLLSAEAVSIPPRFASEMTAYDPTSGELRTHYAGFFDPGFGHDESHAGLRGSRATLEVRAHDVPFMVENRQRICKLVFEPMFDAPHRLYGQDLASNYQGQTVTLSKHFRADRPFRKGQPRLPFG